MEAEFFLIKPNFIYNFFLKIIGEIFESKMFWKAKRMRFDLI